VTEHDQPTGGTPFESNPFASPRAATGPAAWDDGQTLDRGLSWLLFSFRGRIPRRSLWAVWFGLFAVFMVVEILAVILIALVRAPSAQHHSAFAAGLMVGMVVVVCFLGIAGTWVSLAAQVKRWHDRDKSAWWILIGFIPYIGAFWLLIELGCLRGTVGPNTYGPDPT
jgi:uncharacterized membrane protein YhaH (DUF805 family)